MKPIAELYPQEYSDWFCVGSYQPMLDDLGEIVLQVDDDDYQGDSRLLYKDGERYGLLIFGWGSCSGCDSLQGCHSLEEVDELRSQLNDQIKWFDNASDALKYMNEHDWEGDFMWHAAESHEFIARAKAYLEALA